MKKAKIKRRCPDCGTLFVPKKRWQIYDKINCRKAAYYQRRTELLNEAEKIVAAHNKQKKLAVQPE